MTSAALPLARTSSLLVPTVVKQCWLFMIGSALFAAGSAPVLSEQMGSQLSNLLFFIGAWFFTAAGLIQVFLSGAVAVAVPYAPGRMVRAEWLTASTQSFGTLLFNVSTTAALHAKSITAQEKLVWNPDAGGSVAFLISGCVAFIAFAHTGSSWRLSSAACWSVVINFVGCVAFAVSAIGSFILPGGNTVNDDFATWGTFTGAICFFVASLVVLPGAASRHRNQQRTAAPTSQNG